MSCTGNSFSRDGGICNLCPGVTIANDINTDCFCPNGMEPGSSEGSCTSCTGNNVARDGEPCYPCSGVRVANSDRSECVCPDGMESAANTNDCLACSDGEISMDGAACAGCVGSLIPNAAGTMCVECPVNQTADADNMSCVCAPGNLENEAGICVENILGCRGSQIPSASNDRCLCPVAGQTAMSDGTCVLECPDDKRVSNDGNACVCPGDQIDNAEGVCELRCLGGMTQTSETLCDCPAGQTENANGICVAGASGCGNNMTTYNVGALMICGEALPPPPVPQYTASECEENGWEAETVADSRNNIAERCMIPIVIAPLQTESPSASTRDENAPSPLNLPSNLSPGFSANACILRNHDDYRNAGGFPSCAQVFGSGATAELPPRPAGLSVNEVIPVVVRSGSSTVGEPISSRDIPLLASGTLPVSSGGSGSSASVVPQQSVSETNSHALAGALSAAGVLIFVMAVTDPALLNFTPHAEFRVDNGVSYYGYGSKVDFTDESWSGYWQAAQNTSGGKTGDWIYGTGAAWTGSIFTASYANTTRGLESDTAFSLSARKEWNVWTLESSYVADWEVRELNDTWRNRMSLGASAVYNNWTLTPSAELSWKASDSIGDTARFRLNVERDF